MGYTILFAVACFLFGWFLRGRTCVCDEWQWKSVDYSADDRDALLSALLVEHDAALAFIAKPPADMPPDAPYNQHTTASDCQALWEAWQHADEFVEDMKSEVSDGD